MRPKFSIRCIATPIVAGCLLAGCQMGADPNAGWELDMGTLDAEGTKAWELPDSAFAGRQFIVRVATWGNSCVRSGTTPTMRSGMRADLELYDFYQTSDTVECEDYLGPKWHFANLRFDSPGIATIVFHGRRETATGSGSTYRSVIDTVAIETTVRIVP